ncbi:sensor domain-containing protein [Pseudoalteromonas prydzensis]|nr:sensor domain-containing protein [Pseudoalteromonas prydzensis]
MMSNDQVEQNIQDYLSALTAQLQGQDIALIQDALYDAENHFRCAFDAAGRQPSAIFDIIKSYGTPKEIAKYYCDMELTVNWAIYGICTSNIIAPKNTSMFAILKDMSAYKALIYAFIRPPLSIAYFAWTLMVGLCSAAASLFIVGLPILVFYMKSMQYLSLLEGRLIESLLRLRMPRRPANTDISMKQKVLDPLLLRRNWSTSLYLFLQLPLAIVYLLLIVLPTILATCLFLSPIVDPILHTIYPTFEIDINWYWLPATTIVSTGLLMLTLFLAKLLGTHHSKLAKAMLVAA